MIKGWVCWIGKDCFEILFGLWFMILIKMDFIYLFLVEGDYVFGVMDF